MLKNLSFLALAGALTLSVSTTGCIVVGGGDDDSAGDDGTSGNDESNADADAEGDGDGDAEGDGDGDAEGDGDGDAEGDGDGDAEGDGDGDAEGDGDGDTAACGWMVDRDDPDFIPGYYCDGSGEDPSGQYPIACPEDLVVGDPCGEVTGAGCCDSKGNVWFCTEDMNLFSESCEG